MVRLLKKPLTWIVLAESAVVAVLIVVAWSLLVAAAHASAPPPVAQGSASATDAATPAPALPPLSQRSPHPLLPGLNLDSSFWRTRLGELNRDQVYFEQLEWRVVHSGMDAVNRYLENVVLPSITRAEGKR